MEFIKCFEKGTFYLVDYLSIPLLPLQPTTINQHVNDDAIQETTMTINDNCSLLLIHHHKRYHATIISLKETEISPKKITHNYQTHIIQLTKRERVVDYTFAGDYLYSLTNNGEISEWKLLAHGRKYCRNRYLSGLKKCNKFIKVIEGQKFVIHTALRISFVAVGGIENDELLENEKETRSCSD
uniref:Uncharacterized protein n=1 Tax=Rhabditophanes sp. KR3021 TaxID=114890 RepID=A0AC35TXP1_9BILA